MKIYNNEKPYLCLTCNRSFVRKFSLKKHIKIHIMKNLNYAWPTLDHLFQKAALKHTVWFIRKNLMLDLKWSFAQEDTLQMYTKFRNNEKRSYSWLIYKRAFVGKTTWKYVYGSTIMKNLTNAWFAINHLFKNTLKTHMIHDIKKPYLCSECNRLFSR